MRSILLAPVACIPLLLVPACVGDDPVGSAAIDAGDDGAPPSGNDGGTTTPDAASDASGGADQEAGPPACSTIQVSTLSGTGAPGLQEGAGATAKFDDPQGITVGFAGTLYVADNNNDRIREVLSDGTTSTFASAASILSAYRLSFRAGGIYLIDRNDDALRHVIGGTPPQVSTIFQVGALAAVGASTGATYVTQTQNCYISKVNGATPARFSGSLTECGSADGDSLTARFSISTLDIGFDPPSTMYVADTGNFRIRKVSEVDGSVTTLAGSSQGHVDGAGGAAKFDLPTGLTVDPQTHIVYVADRTTIRAISPAGVVTTLVGSTAGFDDGSGCTAKFGELRGIAYYAGALYATDVNRVRKVKLP